MTDLLLCWKCGASLTDLPRPLSRLAECPGCRTDLHVCRMCKFYDPRVSRSCREPISDTVKDKERVNFCGYFHVWAIPYQARDTTTQHVAQTQLEALFGKPVISQTTSSEADAARQQLEKLFGEDKDKK